MKKIFISHRSIDAPIVNEIVQYFENIGVNRDEIMYTSADSTGAQYDIGKEVKEAITSAEGIIVILSIDYFNSVYCCNELGYIWATDKKPIIFGLAGIDTDKDFRGFVNSGWKIRRVNNPSHIDFLYQETSCFSKKEFISPVKPNEYKSLYLDKVNGILEKRLTKKEKNNEIYKPEKIIDIDTLILNNHYMDKELIFFKYLIDSNQYIWGITENLCKDIIEWERKNRLSPFLSINLESFFVMLVNKGYLYSKIITRKDWIVQEYVGKNDDESKKMLALFSANEKGETAHNYFTMDERLFRVITNVDIKSLDIINEAINKHKLKWWQVFSKKETK